MAAAAMGVKPEDDSKSFIKTEPDEDQPMRILDEDDYEDAGELEMPEQLPQAWLARIPKLLYEYWSKIDEDEEVQLGVVRHLKRSNKYEMILDPKIKQNEKAPKRYNFTKRIDKTANTFIFSEKDLPDHKRRMRFKGPAANGKDPLSTVKEGGVDKSKQFQPQYRKTIPKQTSLNASIQTEVTCVAEDNAETRRLEQAHEVEQESKKNTIQFLEGDPRQYTSMAQSGFGGDPLDSFFVRPLLEFAYATKTTLTINQSNAPSVRSRPQENKAARIPRNELLDKLHDCFKEYKYWPMSALKQRLNQPEHYLKETLSMIAELVRSGPYNATWKLRPENQEPNFELLAKAEVAPEDEAMMDGDGNDDDDADTPGSNDLLMDDLPE